MVVFTEELLDLIFIHLNAHTLVHVCLGVCRAWGRAAHRARLPPTRVRSEYIQKGLLSSLQQKWPGLTHVIVGGVVVSARHLSQCIRLIGLSVDGQIEDIEHLPTTLSSLVLLRELRCGYENLSRLSNLTRLELFEKFGVFPVGNAISKLPHLKSLTVSGGSFHFEDGLINLPTTITSLSLCDACIGNTHFLRRLAGLRNLVLNGPLVRDIVIGSLSRLQCLDLSRTKVEDVSFVGLLPHIRTLVLDDLSLLQGKVLDLQPLGVCMTLQRVSLTGARLASLADVVEGSTHCLLSLDLTDTNVKDLQPLSRCHRLTQLLLARTPTRDVSPLHTLCGLRVLSLSGTMVRDVTSLTSCTSLQEVYLGGTPFIDTHKSLMGLPHLRRMQDSMWRYPVDLRDYHSLVLTK